MTTNRHAPSDRASTCTAKTLFDLLACTCHDRTGERCHAAGTTTPNVADPCRHTTVQWVGPAIICVPCGATVR